MGTSVKFTINPLLSKPLFLFLLKSCPPRGASKKVVAKEDSMGSWIGRQAFPHILLSEILYCCSVTQSCLTHGLQHARLLCPLPSPRACSDSCPLSRWCHPTISSSVVPFSFCLQSFPALVFSNESALHIRWPKLLELPHQSFQWIFRIDFL